MIGSNVWRVVNLADFNFLTKRIEQIRASLTDKEREILDTRFMIKDGDVEKIMDNSREKKYVQLCKHLYFSEICSHENGENKEAPYWYKMTLRRRFESFEYLVEGTHTYLPEGIVHITHKQAFQFMSKYIDEWTREIVLNDVALVKEIGVKEISRVRREAAHDEG
jgi:hypothetical protein